MLEGLSHQHMLPKKWWLSHVFIGRAARFKNEVQYLSVRYRYRLVGGMPQTMNQKGHLAEEREPLISHSVDKSLEKQSCGTEGCARMSQKRSVCYGMLFALALLVLLFALIGLPYTMSAIYRLVINKMMQLDPKSPLFAEWVTPNIPMYQSYYVFDIQNPEEFKNGAKPTVVQRGPYVYKLGFDRLNLTFYDNGTLSFYPKYTYHFDEEKSAGLETDRVITLNMPLVTVAYFVRNSNWFIREAANLLMERLGEKLTLNITVGELLWGYEDPIFELIQNIVPIPGFDQGEFGLLIGFNETTNFQYTVFDGKANQSMLNMVNNFQGKPRLSWWWSPETNALKGTDGTMFHPYLQSSEDLYLFHPDLCRYVPYLFQNMTNFKGVPLMRYVLAPYTYDNGTDYPPNAGFCSGNKELCGPSGIMRQDPCRFGSPSAISNPHFYQGDPMLVNAVPGLDPQARLHEHYMEVEPLMGMPYVLKMRLQINMIMEPVKGMKEVEHVRDMAMPVVWFEQSVEANDVIVNYYHTGFILTAYIAMIIKWVLFSGSIVMFLVTVYSFAKRIAYPPLITEAEKNEKIINTSSEKEPYVKEV